MKRRQELKLVLHMHGRVGDVEIGEKHLLLTECVHCLISCMFLLMVAAVGILHVGVGILHVGKVGRPAS